MGDVTLASNLEKTDAREKLIAAFLSGRNERTVRAYAQDLADFRVFVRSKSIADAANLLLVNGHGPANILALSYKTHLVERGLQSATINRRLAALRSLVQLARTFGLVPWTLEVKNVKAENYRDTRGPGKQGFKNLLLQAERKKTAKAVRDRLALRLLYDLALRCGEVVSLDVEDVNIEQGTLAVKGKGRASKQILSLPELSKTAMKDWLQIRGNKGGALLTNFDRAKKGKRLTSGGLYRTVRGLGEKIGMKVQVPTD